MVFGAECQIAQHKQCLACACWACPRYPAQQLFSKACIASCQWSWSCASCQLDGRKSNVHMTKLPCAVPLPSCRPFRVGYPSADQHASKQLFQIQLRNHGRRSKPHQELCAAGDVAVGAKSPSRAFCHPQSLKKSSIRCRSFQRSPC